MQPSICPISGLLVSGEFNSCSAFFLGSILAGNECYRLYGKDKNVWLALTKHNSGYCTESQLQCHFELVKKLTKGMDVTMYKKFELVRRNWFTPNKQGFAAAFETDETVTSKDICLFAFNNLNLLTTEEKKCLLLGAFDGRCSIDVNKKTGNVRYIVLDCGNDDSIELFLSVFNQFNIRYNCNYARDRLEGGEPRKPQLRIAADSVPYYAQNIGFVSPARLDTLQKALGSRYTVSDNPLLPGATHLELKSLNIRKKEQMNENARTQDALIISRSQFIGTNSDMSNTAWLTSEKQEQTFDEKRVCVGLKIKHKSFGDGIVTRFDDKNHIIVKFQVGEKTFPFPDAFIRKFLSIE